MDSYLEIARLVLQAARKPLTPKAILEVAYQADIVPPHLHGKTQHKTLQARLSEDILSRRRNSNFYRTKPGYFFLTEFQTDPDIPSEYKEYFSARRRTRELSKEPALVIKCDFREELSARDEEDWISISKWALKNHQFRYTTQENIPSEEVSVIAFTVVRRSNYVLSYRIGRYRDDRDTFANKRAIGFPSKITQNDHTFFSHDDLGLAEASAKAIYADLDLSFRLLAEDIENVQPSATKAVQVSVPDEQPKLIVINEWDCPDWLEPTSRRLSLNDVCWLNISTPPNNIDDFEPWSAAALRELS